MLKTAYYTAQQQEEMALMSKTVQIKSSYAFLNAHNGLRKGFTHVVLGTTGGGKSTFVRSLIRDVLFGNSAKQKILFWATEESHEECLTEMSFGLPSCDALNSVSIFSESDELMSEKEYILYLTSLIEERQPDVFIMDNITTSAMYEGQSVRQQGAFSKHLKRICKINNVALVIIAHTGAEVSDNMPRLINENDIRGGKQIVNLCEFLYILQRFQIGESFFPTLRVKKHRGQDVDATMYSLSYDKHTRSFKNDNPIPFDRFKEMFKNRNVL